MSVRSFSLRFFLLPAALFLISLPVSRAKDGAEGGNPVLPVTLADVEKAQVRLKGVALHTPLVEERWISEKCGARVFLKLENLQRTGSFKLRGAFNKIASLSAKERARGVIAASAGNHAQGVAFAARHYQIPATIVMPETVPRTKLFATKSYGANVVLFGKVFDETNAKAIELQKETRATLVHPFDDPATIAGQGTIGLEILDDLKDVDLVLVPVGGGGLASGVAVALKGRNPKIRVIGVEPANAPSMKDALKKGGPFAVQIVPTIADGTAVGKSGSITFPIIKALLDDVVLVSEKEISDAMRVLLLKDKVLAEGAGALSAAAVLSGKVDVKGRKAALIISGGNVDPAVIVRLLNTAIRSEEDRRP
jgi:threonine dehydratase